MTIIRGFKDIQIIGTVYYLEYWKTANKQNKTGKNLL